MSYVDNTLKNKAKPELQFLTENNQYTNSLNQKKTIYFRDTIKQNGPKQKYAEHIPYAYRSGVKPQGDDYMPYFENYPRGDINPLTSRQNLSKFLKTKNSLFGHHRQCQACSRLNGGSYGKNYYTSYQKTFPLIKGSFVGDNSKYPNIKKSCIMPYQARSNGKLKYKLKNNNTLNYDNYDNYIYNETNCNEDNKIKYPKIEKNNTGPDTIEKQNNRYNTIDATNSIKNENYGNQVLNSYSYKPRFRRTFHKRQIFNNYKPFMVDDFHEYADYE